MNKTAMARLLEIPLITFNEPNPNADVLVYPTISPSKLGCCSIVAVDEHRNLINDAIDELPECLLGANNPDGSMRYFQCQELFELDLPVSSERVAALVLTLGFATGRTLPVLPRYIWPRTGGLPLVQIRKREEAWQVPKLTRQDIYKINSVDVLAQQEVHKRLSWLLPDDATEEQIVRAYCLTLPDILFWLPEAFKMDAALN